MIVEAPCPQPTSATVAPVSSRSPNPPRAGRPALEPPANPLERGDPRSHEVRVVAGTEEALGAEEQVRLVLVPAHAFSAADRLHHFWRGADGGDHALEAAEDASRALLVRQALRLLLGEEIASRLGI